ncbi:hypothetical protein B0I32_1428 [Nonomuraea fuscirosea]|uniref:Uncharacterized protein n=1 Tax=Nonomuraea fuscirosea TaxID=1291556 RepID=A0A2T0LU92_9ACTN|nr:hypothetical protein [Nonomuraea fuscirosea]PRX47411.1 hypothetical protein B0I32_1428 [Nonomuraea fuscirosea]
MDALIEAACAALLGAMANDAWSMARARFARLFGQGDARQEEITLERLDQSAAAVEASPPQAHEAIRQKLLPSWRTRIGDLLQEQPEIADELRTLVEQIRGQLPPAQAATIQTNVAYDQGTVYAVQTGVQNIHRFAPTELERSTSGTPDVRPEPPPSGRRADTGGPHDE